MIKQVKQHFISKQHQVYHTVEGNMSRKRRFHKFRTKEEKQGLKRQIKAADEIIEEKVATEEQQEEPTEEEIEDD